MIKNHCIGYPRIGPKRELKTALEKYWKGEINENELQSIASNLKRTNWEIQKSFNLDLICSNDFSYYDQVLDTICLMGAIPERFKSNEKIISLKTYFAMARGSQTKDLDVSALEMTKWFDTNYHYLVPEFNKRQKFKLSSNKIFDEFLEAKKVGIITKPILLGPLTFLELGKTIEAGFEKIDLLECLLPVYKEIIEKLNNLGAEWIQIDEPILVKSHSQKFIKLIKNAFDQIKSYSKKTKILLTTYFETVDDKILNEISNSNIDAVHFDCVRGNLSLTSEIIKSSKKIISLGVVDGRNIWKSNLKEKLEFLESFKNKNTNIWVSTSCPLLHCPYDLDLETKVPSDIRNWLAFSKQKLKEMSFLKDVLNNTKTIKDEYYLDNQKLVLDRKNSKKINNANVKNKTKNINEKILSRISPFSKRIEIQNKIFNLPTFPTTTIGSFPQTTDVRISRAKYKKGEITEEQYINDLETKTIEVIKKQEEIGIDVLVHGEFERNDMVEYFGEQLEGFTFTSSGWVQSYGSRCVKPPIIFGDVSRPNMMTVKWSKFAQQQTNKIVKGMLTGPITILQWSFVRDDQPRQQTAYEIAFAIRDEVKDLEANGIKMIQIDEPALREGLPLKQKDWNNYLKWAVNSFKISSSVVQDETQIHTHMCYAEFEDIIQSIADLDADVISIETSRSRMELLTTFEKFNYPNQIGPGVYDIHSPRVPHKNEMKSLIERASKILDKKKIWVNPDCGLKTRGWPETIASLEMMVQAAKELRSGK